MARRLKLRRVRSALFTPGTEPGRLLKAVETGADVCIFDLEDSVPPGRVAEARQIVSKALDEVDGRARIWVRVHAASSAAMAEDLAAISGHPLEAVMLPKVSAAEDTEGCRQAMRAASLPPDLPVVPIIETARGVLTVREIAATAGVESIALGRFDLAADLAIDADGGSPAFAAARAAVVLASRAEGLLQPLDSPWITIRDLDGLGAAAARARADGFGGMLLIHPSHIGMVNQVFAPTAEELDWARRIIESAEQAGAAGRGAYAMDGAMVDEAIIKRARAILEESG